MSKLLTSTTDIAERVPNFPGRATIGHIADVVSYALHPQAKKGIPKGFNGLGNQWVMTRRNKRPTKVEIYKPVIPGDVRRNIKTIDLDI